MADNVLSDISNALSQAFQPELQRQFNQMAVTASLLPSESAAATDNGKNVAWDVEFDGATAAAFAEGADVDPSEYAVNAVLPATLSWARYRSAFQMSRTVINAAAQSKGSAGLVDLFRVRMLDAGTKLASVINGDVINGDGTDGSGNATVVGLFGGALAASGIYATINRGDYPLWAGNVLANGGVARPLTLDLMEQADQNIFTASSLKYNAIVVSPGVWRKYKGLFQPGLRVMSEAPIKNFDGSTSDLFFNGVPVFRDKDFPESGGKGSMAFLNTTKLSKVYLPEAASAAYNPVKIQIFDGEGSNGDSERTSLSVPFTMVPVALTGDNVKFYVRSELQLRNDRPNAHALVTDIAV